MGFDLTASGWVGGATAYLGGATAYLVGWLETDNRAISVQLDLTGTATGNELGKNLVLVQGRADGGVY